MIVTLLDLSAIDLFYLITGILFLLEVGSFGDIASFIIFFVFSYIFAAISLGFGEINLFIGDFAYRFGLKLIFEGFTTI